MQAYRQQRSFRRRFDLNEEMAARPEVSVVIPTRDRAVMVDRAVAMLERQSDVEPALRLRVVVTGRVCHLGPKNSSGSIDRRRVPVERVQIDDASECMSPGIEDTKSVVHRFEYVSVARA